MLNMCNILKLLGIFVFLGALAKFSVAARKEKVPGLQFPQGGGGGGECQYPDRYYAFINIKILKNRTSN